MRWHIEWKTGLMKYCPHVHALKFHNLGDKGNIVNAPTEQQKVIHKVDRLSQQYWIKKEWKMSSISEGGEWLSNLFCPQINVGTK